MKMRVTAADPFLIDLFNEQDRRSSSVRNVNKSSAIVAAKDLGDFIFVNGRLYRQGNGGVLRRALSLTEKK